MKAHTQHSIGKPKAIELFHSKWWEGKSHREKAEVQLFTVELCMPFDLFHESLEACLGRPVWTHELGLNLNGLCQEFLGQRPAPSFEDILNLIPEEKRILVAVAT